MTLPTCFPLAARSGTSTVKDDVWDAVIGGYRHFDYRFGQDTGMKALSFGGPVISFGFRW